MTDHCCGGMDSACRTFWKGQPEEEKRDACIEWRPDSGPYLVADNKGEFTTVIRYCPWCGTQLFGDRHSDIRRAAISN